MKKNLTYLCSAILAMILFGNVLFAQESTDKRVVITIRSTNADGKQQTSTVIKSGEDAVNFDVDKYVKEQTKDKENVQVTIDNNVEEKAIHRNHDRMHNYNFNFNQNSDKTNEKSMKMMQSYGSEHGFLGVSELSSDKDVVGVRVNITRSSGADKAGLKDDDVILQLNKTPINSFRDISVFMRKTKEGDRVEVVYERDGATKTTSATLGKQQMMWTESIEKEKEACLGVYSSSQVVEGQRGAVIKDFTELSAARDVKMQEGDLITSVNGVRVKSHQDVWDEIAKYRPRDVVTVAYLRDNTPKTVKATLKACKPKDTEDVIVVPKTTESTQGIVPPANLGKLELDYFSASPNPTKEMVQISFKGAAVPTQIAFYDLTGKVLYQQTLNDFNGEYNQRFDLDAYAKGVVVIKIQQGDKVFSKQIVVN